MKKYLGKIVAGVGILFAVLALIMLVAPGWSPKSEYKDVMDSVSVSKFFFGSDKEELAVSIGGVIAMILVIVGAILLVVALLGKGGKVVPIAAAVCLLVGGILYFCTIQLLALDFGEMGDLLNSDQKKEAKDKFIDLLKEQGGLGAGAIMGGIFSILGALCAGSLLFVNKNN